jgi:hypothetical protein
MNRRTISALAVLAATGAAVVAPTMANAGVGETVIINWSVDPATYQLTASATGGLPGETINVSSTQVGGGSTNKPATFVITAIGGKGDAPDQVFDRYTKVVVCTNSSTCTATPTLGNVPPTTD